MGGGDSKGIGAFGRTLRRGLFSRAQKRWNGVDQRRRGQAILRVGCQNARRFCFAARSPRAADQRGLAEGGKSGVSNRRRRDVVELQRVQTAYWRAKFRSGPRSVVEG